MTYHEIIREATGAPRHELAAIEDVMRTQRPTFDSMTRGEIARLARDAWEALRLMRLMREVQL